MKPPVKSYQSGQLPTPAEMQAFADRFDAPEWQRLCANQTFLNTVCHDLNACVVMAERILAGKPAIDPKKHVDAATLRDNPDAWKKS